MVSLQSDEVQRYLRLKSTARAVAPTCFVAAIVVAAVAANQYAHLRWFGPDPFVLLACLGAVAGLSLVVGRFGMTALAELLFIVPLHLAYANFGLRLTYIAEILNRPLVDAMLIRLDLALGFSWKAWAELTDRHPVFHHVQSIGYASFSVQEFISIVLFTFLRPRDRNYEMLFILTFSLGVTIAVSALLPTLGPASLQNILVDQERILRLLRSGYEGPYAFAGIVSFPSYHTVMALTLIYCHRDIMLTRPFVIALNLLMLVSIPYCGDHYITDMIAGVAVAAGTILLSRLIYAPRYSRYGPP